MLDCISVVACELKVVFVASLENVICYWCIFMQLNNETYFLQKFFRFLLECYGVPQNGMRIWCSVN